MRASRVVEAILFASSTPLSAADLARGYPGLDAAGVEAALGELCSEYAREERAFELREIAGGFQLLTRPEYAPVLQEWESVAAPARLSVAALETLAIVAYRQPVGRAEIEGIRGVGGGGVLRTLLERELIRVAGRGEGLGRPLLYGTTDRFLEHFGFRSLGDLPDPAELPVVLAPRSAEHAG